MVDASTVSASKVRAAPATFFVVPVTVLIRVKGSAKPLFTDSADCRNYII